MRMLKKIIRKLYHLIWFLSVFLIFTPSVFAEMPSGEQYSEFATHRYQLLKIHTSTTEFGLYAYNWAGHEPTFDKFMNGNVSLVRYENSSNDTYSKWAINIFNQNLATNTYLLTWITSFSNSSQATEFCGHVGSATSIKNGSGGASIGRINSSNCSTSGANSYVLVNFTLTSGTQNPYIDLNGSISANWFLRLAVASYYPQITPSAYFDTNSLQQQNGVIISQNQTVIEQNRQQILNDNQNTQNIIDANRYDNQQIQGAIEDTNDTLKDETAPNLDLSDLEVSSDTPISDLITMPLTILNTLIQTLDGSCTNYTIPFFYNNSLTFPCFTISDYLGSTVTNYIDLFICFYMCYNIAMLVVSVFEDVTSLRDIYDSMYVPKHAESGYQPKHAKGGGN